MPEAVSLSSLATRVRYYANMEGSTFVSDAELTERLKASARRLYGKLVAARGQEYYRRNYNFSTVAGTQVYDLPSDFWQLLSVIVQDGSTYLQLRPFEMGEAAALLNVSAPRPSAHRYRLTGAQTTGSTSETDQLELLPAPVAVFPVGISFLPRLTFTANGGEYYINGVAGFEEWAVLDVAIQCLAKEESDPSALMQLKAEVERDIESLAGARDAGSAARVADVRGDLGRLNPWLLPPRWGGLP